MDMYLFKFHVFPIGTLFMLFMLIFILVSGTSSIEEEDIQRSKVTPRSQRSKGSRSSSLQSSELLKMKATMQQTKKSENLFSLTGFNNQSVCRLTNMVVCWWMANFVSITWMILIDYPTGQCCSLLIFGVICQCWRCEMLFSMFWVYNDIHFSILFQ